MSDVMAMILAGGKGSRMTPFQAPKCLMPVNGLPILHRIIYHLRGEGGVSRIRVCLGYRAGDVASAIDSWGLVGVDTSTISEDAEPCNRLINAKPSDFNGRILVCYGDELADVHVQHLLQYHEAHKALATVTAWKHRLEFGLVKENQNHDLRGIKEKAEVPVNIGFVVLETQAFGFMKPKEDLVEFLNGLVHRGLPVKVFWHEGRRTTVNAVHEVARAEEVWK